MSQERETLFKYNGVEYEFDVSDADDAEKIEKAYKLMTEEEKNIPKTGKSSDMIRRQCKLIKNFLDRTLGTGAGNNLCGEKSNIHKCYSAYEEFLGFVNRQKGEIIAHGNKFKSYSNRNKNNKNFMNKK